MKGFLSFAVSIFVLSANTAFADDFHLMNVGFAAPAIAGQANIPLPETGAIIYDTSAVNFYGYNGTSWVVLGSAAASVPAGTVSAFAGTSAPTGYLVCNGAAVSRTTYSALFAVLGTTYGSGDGSTTFNLPNAQGVFLKGAGSQTISSISYSGTQGTTQGDQIQGHYHGISPAGGNVASGAGSTFVSGSGLAGLGLAVLSPTSDGTNGTPRTGPETHPANISVLYIVKY